MVRGKQTCKILKDIRRQIAEANDIEYITSECQYKGDCTGTCPKCEAEVQYLEQQLARKHMAGKAITILGVSAGLATMMPQPACAEPIHSEAPHGYYIVTPEIQEKPVIRVLPPVSRTGGYSARYYHIWHKSVRCTGYNARISRGHDRTDEIHKQKIRSETTRLSR